jgi:hypothetical protein
VAGSRAAGRLEESHWLCPVEDLRRKGSPREGMLENFSLGSYLLLVDYTSRLVRQGKARVSRQVAGILERLGTSVEFWQQRMRNMFQRSRLLGSYVASDRQRLLAVAQQRGVHHVNNTVRLAGAG